MYTATTTRAHKTAKQRIQGETRLKLNKGFQLKIALFVYLILTQTTQKNLRKALLTSQSQEPTFKVIDKMAKNMTKIAIDLNGQDSKKYEVLKASNTTEPSIQSESIC